MRTSKMHVRYEEDFYEWAVTNARLLKQKKYDEADMEHIIEELEEMGISNKHALKNRLAQLIFHLLKWHYQPDFRGRSWHGTVKEQRIRLKDLLEDNPSLKGLMDEALKKAYAIATTLIEKETPIDLNLLPANCPYAYDQLMNDAFYPE